MEFGLKRTIALVAHDNKKTDLVEWVEFNKGTLARHNLYATGGTGKRITEKTGLNVTLLKDGSQGGDMELGALIANKKLDYLIFFWDPLESLPHDVDVKALLRIAVLYNIPTACNRATADLIISSLCLAWAGNSSEQGDRKQLSEKKGIAGDISILY